MTIINEPGLYSLIFRSNKPEAKQFKRWVTHEVLPEIRKKGSYTKQDDKLEIAKLIVSCKSATAVKGILSLYGIQANTPSMNFYNVESVEVYLQTVEIHELTDKPQKEVYAAYVHFAKAIVMFLFHFINFQKQIHTQIGLVVKRRRLNGVLTSFYD